MKKPHKHYSAVKKVTISRRRLLERVLVSQRPIGYLTIDVL
jgi:hypothetical protein